MVKFKMNILINSADFFKIAAQYVPFQILEVEEIIEQPPPKASPQATSAIKARVEARRKQAEQSRPYRRYGTRKPTRPLDANSGINKIILDFLADGKPHRAAEIKPALQAGNYSGNSVGSRLQNLQKHRLATQMGDGTWVIRRPVDVVPPTEPAPE